ncbi:MAG TPA: SDR family oxidoreductase [Blastococcus sp.]|nr:SDR family oxidoreductase [Blastococcus sp.]
MRVSDPDRRNLLEGKVGLVTGGAGSLGLATAKLFLKEGAHVVLSDRNGDALAAAASRLDDVNVTTVVSDATSEDDVAAAFDTVMERHGRLDVLVANAGTPAVAAPVTAFDTDEFDRTFAVHVRGVFLACKYGLRVMGAGGSVVIVSGVAGLRADPGVCAYIAAKHAQVGLMRSVAKEAAPRGIRVNTIHPGPVENDFQAGIERRLTEVLGTNATEFFDQQIPLGRHARPEEIARSVLYLASSQSSFTTASTLVVDGGLSA